MPEPRPIRRILHASDFSPASRRAFRKAVELARANRAELTVAHVIQPVVPIAGEGYVSPKVYEEMLASARTWARKQLAGVVARARRGRVRARGVLLDGVPHVEIARAARRERADLVVIGTQGRTGLARLFLGSVAARVVAIAPCPVLTVRGR